MLSGRRNYSMSFWSTFYEMRINFFGGFGKVILSLGIYLKELRMFGNNLVHD
jgi:hypothetical protein